jgi:deoxyribonuclease V
LERLTDHLHAMPILVELRSEQERLAQRVREEDDFGDLRTLGGADVAYIGNQAFAAAVALDAESLQILDVVERELEVEFPYIPSYLAFREFPAIQAVVNGLRRRPDVLFIDGHGRLHPVLFGFACYAGVSLDTPTIGIAKHALVGSPVASQRMKNGAVPIKFGGRVQGFAWIPPRASRAFYVSVGNRITLETALGIAQGATRDRYPEPLRIADHMSKEGKRKKNEERNASGLTATRRPPAQGLQGI